MSFLRLICSAATIACSWSLVIVTSILALPLLSGHNWSSLNWVSAWNWSAVILTAVLALSC